MDEAEQRVLLRVWAHWAIVAPLPLAARRAWMRTTAYNVLVDELRRLSREPVVS